MQKRGLPGKRVEAKRAGMIPRVLEGMTGKAKLTDLSPAFNVQRIGAFTAAPPYDRVVPFDYEPTKIRATEAKPHLLASRNALESRDCRMKWTAAGMSGTTASAAWWSADWP